MTPEFDQPRDPAAALVDAQGASLARRKKEDKACPRCGADRRVLSAGFGSPHDVCATCGHDFPERTL